MSRMNITMPEEIIRQIKEIAKHEFRRPGQQALNMIKEQLKIQSTQENEIPATRKTEILAKRKTEIPEDWQIIEGKQYYNTNGELR